MDDLPKTVQYHVTHLLKQARSQIVDEGEVEPAFVLYSENDTHIVDARARNNAEKDMVAFMVRQLAALHEAHTICHIGEIWGFPDDMPSERQAELLAKYGSVGGCPGRIELVMVKVETRDGGMFLVRAQIMRNGRAVTLAKPTVLDTRDMEFGGRYVGLFAPEKPAPDLNSPKDTR
jgi:hypothetical protein